MSKLRIYFVILGLSLLLWGCSEPFENYNDRRLANVHSSSSPSLSLQWFGAAFVAIDDGSTTMLFDPFVSQKENQPWDVLLGNKAIVADERIKKFLNESGFDKVQSIFVGHSHYDHSLDVAAFSKHLKAPVFGSQSTQRVVKSSKHHTFNSIKNGDVLLSREVGNGFKVHVFPGKHGTSRLR